MDNPQMEQPNSSESALETSLFSKVGRVTDVIEESLIAFFLGAMTLLTFANVVFRYAFNDNILWALELTVFMFAWMVLVGASYGVKKHFHIGVDVIINLAPEKLRKVYALIAVDKLPSILNPTSYRFLELLVPVRD